MTGSRTGFLYAPAPLISRGSALPFYGMLLAVAIAGGVLFGAGVTQSAFAVKATLLVAVGIVGTAFVLYRPVLFPLCLYMLSVPFDGILETGAGTGTKFLAAASTIVILVVLIDRRRTILPPPATLAWGAYILFALASMMWSADPAFGWPQLSTTLQLFVVFAVVSMLRIRAKEAYLFAGAALAGGVALAFYSLYLYVTGSGLIHNGQGEERLLINLGHSGSIGPDYIAATLVPSVGLAFALALRPRSWIKLVSVAALVVLLAGIFVTAARGSLVGVGAMWLYLMIVSRRRLQLAFVALLGLLASIPLPDVWLRFVDPSQGDASGRYGIWKVGWNAFQHYWLYGIGIGQFRVAYAQAYLDTHLVGIIFPWSEDPQNLIVATSVELGIIGLALMLLAWVVQLRVMREVPETTPLYDLRLGIEAGTVGLFVTAMTADMMFYKFLWLTFVLGALVRSAWNTEARSLQGSAPSAGATPGVTRAALSALPAPAAR